MDTIKIVSCVVLALLGFLLAQTFMWAAEKRRMDREEQRMIELNRILARCN